MSIVIALIVFGIIILVHELGHFFAARKVGILVEEFAIGMGPKLFSVKKGETVYSLRLFPMGGFCKMLGEDENNYDPRAFNNKTVGQRALTLSMGVIANLILAFVLFTVLALSFGYSDLKVTEVSANTGAAAAGLMPDDVIKKVGNTRINIRDDLVIALAENGVKPIDITIKRGKELLVKTITPYQSEDGQYLLGVVLTGYGGLVRFDMETAEGEVIKDERPMGTVWGYLSNGFWQIVFWVKLTIIGVIRLFTFSLSADQIGGPIMIVSVMNDAYTGTITQTLEQNGTMLQAIVYAARTMVKYMAIISANLGVMNLLPLPALDGGRLVFLGIEKIRRKPVSPEREGFVHLIGFAALIAFAIFIAFKDIKNLL